MTIVAEGPTEVQCSGCGVVDMLYRSMSVKQVKGTSCVSAEIEAPEKWALVMMVEEEGNALLGIAFNCPHCTDLGHMPRIDASYRKT